MIQVSLTAWFGYREEDADTLVCGLGIVGDLTEEQYNAAMGWLRLMSKWTDENRKWGDAE